MIPGVMPVIGSTNPYTPIHDTAVANFPVESYENLPEASVNRSQNENDYLQQILDLVKNIYDSQMNNYELYQDSKKTTIEEAEKSYNRQRELMQLQFDLQKQMRSTQMQDTIEDLRKAGINPAVYFAYGGQPNSSQGISSGSVNAASINNPNSDTLSSLASSVASVLSAVATNKNADSAVFRSIISAIGGIFSFGVHGVSNIPTTVVRNQIGF